MEEKGKIDQKQNMRAEPERSKWESDWTKGISGVPEWEDERDSHL